jgi:hypothetical protein
VCGAAVWMEPRFGVGRVVSPLKRRKTRDGVRVALGVLLKETTPTAVLLETAPPLGRSRQAFKHCNRRVATDAGVRNATAIGQWRAGDEVLTTAQ